MVTVYNEITITLTPSIVGNRIFYTTNGTSPSTVSQEYTTPFVIDSDCTLKTIEYSSDLTNYSDIVEEEFTFQCHNVIIDPAGKNFKGSMNISMNCATENAEIRYTTDDSFPDENSLLYTGTFSITSTIAINAKAFKTGYAASDTSREIYIKKSGGNQMNGNAQQAAELKVVYWTETGTSTKRLMGKTPLDGQNLLSFVEKLNFFKNKIGGNNPVEATVDSGENKFTLDMELDATVREYLANTTAKDSDGKFFGGMNVGKLAKTGQLIIRPQWANGYEDDTQDITLFKVVTEITEEFTNSNDGKKLTKVIFTALADEIDVELGTTSTDPKTGTLTAATYKFVVTASNVFGMIASATMTEVLASAGGVEVAIPTVRPPGATSYNLYYTTATTPALADWKYKAITDAEIAAGKISILADASLPTVAAVVEPVSTANTPWFYATHKA